MRGIFVLTLLALMAVPLARAAQEQGATYRDPTRWDADIARFEASDAEEPPPTGAVVCVGSSSMRMWDGLADDLAPLTVVHRGFGGSNMNDLLHYVDRVVLAYRPRAVLIYEGDNDIHQGLSPEQVTAKFVELVEAIHAELPDCRVYLLAIKPSPRRWGLWPEMVRANAMLAEVCNEDERLAFIDIATPMLDDDGEPRAELYVDDRLHMTRAGYEIWRGVVRPTLVQAERPFEEARQAAPASE